MPGTEFFARMGAQFAEHAGAARENAGRQAAAEQLVAKIEYEFEQMRRELSGVLDAFAAAPDPSASTLTDGGVRPIVVAAEAA